METIIVKVVVKVEVPEEIQERFLKASKDVRVSGYINNHTDVKAEVLKGITEIADIFGG